MGPMVLSEFQDPSLLPTVPPLDVTWRTRSENCGGSAVAVHRLHLFRGAEADSHGPDYWIHQLQFIDKVVDVPVSA